MKRKAKSVLLPGAENVCAIYARFSSHSQREVSIEQQAEECRAYAARRGYQIASVYADKAISGTLEDRPQFQKMIADADRGAFGHVVTYKVDRFARDRLDSAIYKSRLRRLGISVEYACEDVPDTPIGILVEGMLESQAEFYVANLRQDVIRGCRHNAEHGISNGPLPFGYRRADAEGHIEIDPPAAEIVREIYRRYAAGDRPVDIAADLNRRGLVTRTGRPYTLSTFKRILSNERYTGVYIYDDVRLPGAMPAIIDADLFDKVAERRAILAHAPASKAALYALSGKVFCGVCQSLMTGEYGTSANGERYFYYACSHKRRGVSCTLRPVGRDKLERAVCNLILANLTDEGIEQIADAAESFMRAEIAANSESGALRAELADVKKRLANVQKTLEMVASETMAARLVELEERRAALEAALVQEDARDRLFDRDLFVAFLRMTRSGDVDDPEFRQTLFDVYVSRVYVYDSIFTVDLNTGDTVQSAAVPDDPPDLPADGFSVRPSGAEVHQTIRIRTFVVRLFGKL